ncbi:MAG: HAMP domain-containing histidine kinase [Planctomycetes bacterium]|nr:HAMP domain-containing histidine kinase [Planctomycetota bacterium]
MSTSAPGPPSRLERPGVAPAREAVHEANNLLQAIAAEAYLLLDRAGDDPARVLLGRIADQAVAAGHALSRVVEPAIDEPLAPLGAGDLVAAALAEVEARATRRGVALTRDVDPAPRVLARRRALVHALVNLLVNAVQSGARRVSLAVGAGGPRRLRVRVRDDGPGIPGAVRALLLQAPVTTKPPREGMGLGLLIARQVFEEHGGRLAIDSRAGEFTEVSVDLPVVE